MKNSYSLRIRIIFAAIGIITSTIGLAQVTVNATGGVATASYASLRLAFNAINAGTHTGTIAIGISANTTETAPCVLNGSGAGAASYTTIGIAPIVDGVTISGTTGSGRGLIELNGADNVIIDGDNPNTGGTNRNLTIKNSTTVSLKFTSCIRLATSTLITSCDNITIRNLNLNGNGVGTNTGAYLTELASWGVIASGNASTVAATTAPSNLTSTTTLIPAGQTLSNLVISNNNIQTVSRGVSINGSSVTVATSLMIANNIIGNSSIGAVDQVTGIGITVQGTSNGTISGNAIRIEGYVNSSATNRAINVGLISTAGVSGMIIEKNTIEKNYNNNTKTHAAIGIDISGGNNHVIRNNFVGQCLNSQVAGTSGFNTTNGIAGIRILGGTGHQIYHNTVHLSGAISGTTGKNIAAALEITTTAATGLDVRNNIFSNQITGGNPTLYNTVIVSMFLPAGATSAMNLTLNNNTYYQGSSAQNGIAQVGTTGSAANLYKSANFNSALTTPVTNLRAYTNNLAGTATNDNASYASLNATPVIAPTNLHISFASPELPNVDQKGVVLASVPVDIDGDVRPSASTTTPDIGADEFTVPPCLAANGGTITPSSYSACTGQTIALTSVGATNATGITYQWMISSTPGGPYSNVSGGTGANTVSFTTPSLTLGTNYYVLQTTCSAGPLIGLSNEATVITNSRPVVTVSGSSSFCVGGNVLLTGTIGGTSQWYANDSLIVGATSNTYTVTAAGYYNMIQTNGAGCSDSATTGITVNVNTLPTIGITTLPASATLCAGANAKLTGTGATSYVWTGSITNNVSFIPAATATYTVTGTDINGCTNTATQTITVNTLPTVTASATPATLCSGDNTTLMGAGASTYTWTGGITDNVGFAPVSSGTYTVTGTDLNGCTNTATQSITVNSLPTVTATATPAAICVGATTTLNGGGAVSYSWSGGVSNNVAFTPVSSATYTVTGTDGNGCVNTTIQSVTVNTLPTVTATATPTTICSGTNTTLAGGGATSYTWSGGVTNNVAFAPVSSATYTVTGTDGNGCTNTATQSVTVNTLPTISIMAMPSTVCAGGTTTLMGMGATSYSWSGGVTDGVSFVPASSATYTVTGTDGSGCTNTATQSITVNPLPTVSFAPFATSVCDNASAFALTGGSPTGGTYSGTSVSAGMFDPTAAGMGMYLITYTISDINSCVNSDTASITVDLCSGVLADNNSYNVSVYPNPTDGMLNISLNNITSSEVKISIADAQGKVVYNSMESNITNGTTKEINLTNVAKGIYYIKLSTSKDVKVQKLIIQ